jgi:hypothetical protein
VKKTAFSFAVAQWVLGWVSSDQLPAIAMKALEEGIESTTLSQLSVEEAVGNPDLHAKFEKALSEIGMPKIDKANAGRIVARYIAQKICDGHVTPIEGAREIWKITLECRELTDELGIFSGRASEYEDLPDMRDRISEMIVHEAQSLIGNTL